MRKAKVKRYEIGGDVDYARNENREGRESTLDPSDIEDAIRGRQMTGSLGQVEYSPNFETSPVRSEYDAQSGLDYAPGMGNRKPIAAAKPRPKPPVKPAAPATKPPASPVKRFAPTPIPEREDVPTAVLPKKRPVKRESMFSPRGESISGMTRGMMKRPEGYAKGGSVGSASKRADGIAIRGKTRGKMV
jgi:hypothetical protein